MPGSLRADSQAPCGNCYLIRSNASPGGQVSSCDQETILIEGSKQGLKVRYLPDSCLAHSPYRTMDGRGLWLCRWSQISVEAKCKKPMKRRASFSLRVKMRRYHLILLVKRTTMLRSR